MEEINIEFIKLFAPVITGVFAVFSLTMTGIGWFIKNLIIKNHEKEIKETEQKFNIQIQSYQHKHNITKDLYIKIFEKRIETYVDIHKILANKEKNSIIPSSYDIRNKLKDSDSDIEDSDFIEDLDGKISIINNISSIIIENQIYLSQDIWDKYKDLTQILYPYLRKKNTIEETYSYYDDDTKKLTSIHEEEQSLALENYKEIIDAIDLFLKAIDQEMKKIREEIT